MKILGNQFGIELGEEIGGGNGVLVHILSEDDELWHPHGDGFSSFWLRDLMEVCENALGELERRKERD